MNDDQLRKIMKESLARPAEGFKNRVLHRIETEKVLQPESIKSAGFSILPVFSILFAMSGLVLFTCLYFYNTIGPDFWKSSFVLNVILLITAVSGMFYLISVFDDRRLFNLLKK